MKLFRTLIITAIGLIWLNVAAAGSLPGPLVETDWLAKNKNQVTILEIRQDVKSFTKKPRFIKNKKTGKTIPRHYITEVKCEHNGKNNLTLLWRPCVSNNPFLSFDFYGAKKGDSVKISWVDNQVGKGGSSATI